MNENDFELETDKEKDSHEGMPNYESSPVKESVFYKMFLKNKKRYLIAFLVALVIWVIIVCAKGYSAYQSYLDATFIVATIYICLGGLLWTTNMGVFDGLNYGLSKAFTSKNHSKDLYSYMQTKNTKRQKTKYAWTTFIVIGVLLFLITLILYIIYVNKILPSLAD
jgi:amino acid transporter